MAFEDFLKQFSILNTAPWNSPPTFPVPEVGRLTAPPDELPGVRQSIQGGMDLIEPDMERARKNTLNNIGPMLAFLPLMLAGSKNRGKGLTSFARALGTGVSRERNAQEGMEYWRAEQMNTRTEAQRKALLEEIKQNRGLMEKAAGLDPALWGNQEFVNAWLSGDITYLPKAGWRPPEKAEKKSYQLAEVGGNKVVFDPSTGELVRTLGRAGSGAKKEESPVTTAEKTIFSYLMNGGDASKLKPVEQNIAVKKGWLKEEDSKVQNPVTEEERNIFTFLKGGGSPDELDEMRRNIAQRKGWLKKESGDIKRTDKDAIYRYVRGGTDIFGNRTEGLANLTKERDQALQALKVRYGEGSPEYEYALGILVSDPTSPLFEKPTAQVPVQQPIPQTAPQVPPVPPPVPQPQSQGIPVPQPQPNLVVPPPQTQRPQPLPGTARPGQGLGMSEMVQSIATSKTKEQAMRLLSEHGGDIQSAIGTVMGAKIPEEAKRAIIEEMNIILAGNPNS